LIEIPYTEYLIYYVSQNALYILQTFLTYYEEAHMVRPISKLISFYNIIL